MSRKCQLGDLRRLKVLDIIIKKISPGGLDFERK
jgi:hypothetical protein